MLTRLFVHVSLTALLIYGFIVPVNREEVTVHLEERRDMYERIGSTPLPLTFAEILGKAWVEAGLALMDRARVANRLAKISKTSGGRHSAYRVKSRALNRGLEMGALVARSDEDGRNHLLRVGPRGGAALHIPIGELSVISKQQTQVRAVLGIDRPEAA